MTEHGITPQTVGNYISHISAVFSVAEAAWVALTSGSTGRCWVVQPGRAPVEFRFANVPGPRAADGSSLAPPPALG